jgi:hypothetical protein
VDGPIEYFSVLQLEQNLGNQGAISRGLRFAFDNANPGDQFLVMDSDGEDSPTDIIRLLEFSGMHELVVAQRKHQKANLNLRLWHNLFKFALRFLTGKKLDFGNFSLISYQTCEALLSNSSIGISYVGCLLKSNIEIKRVTLARGSRYEGESKTNKDGLLVWGFLVLSVFSDRIFAKLVRVGVIFGVFSCLGVFTVLVLRLFTNLTIPGWSGLMISILGSSIVQILLLLAGFIMLQSQINSKR